MIAQILRDRGEALSKLGKYEEAIQALDKAIVLNPKLEAAWSHKEGLSNFLDSSPA